MNQCDNGHFYDEARFESCPYCKENTGIGKTMAAADIGKTVAAFPGNPAAAAATAFDSGKTVHTAERISVSFQEETLSAGLPRWMFPCQTTIPYPVKAMHWSLTMPNTMPFPFRPGRDAALPTAMMNRSKWFIHSKHTTSSRSGKADCFSCLFAANSFSGVRNSSCSFLKSEKKHKLSSSHPNQHRSRFALPPF